MVTFPYLQAPFQNTENLQANPAAIVSGPQVRFTVLTSRLIRMEFSLTGEFEDRPSQAFWYRRQPVPAFSVDQTEETIEIDTEHLRLHYRVTPQGFAPTTLQVEVKSTGAVWYFGDPPWRGRNLGGTARTLDKAVGEVELEPGLMGRMGWAVVDDSRSLVFTPDGWLTRREALENRDLYFFGYGHAYPECLQDFSRLSGPAPMIPRWALGNWWSRFWAYSQDELLGLMHGFKEHGVPLSVCIVDMDWHITQTGNRSTGWTGYTWNRELFPDPQGFIDELHRLGLKTALNLHPAEGVHAHEAGYPALAAHLGLDPATGDPIPFDPTDPQFIQGYFEFLHYPLEVMGVDFWWMDWQQGKESRLAGLDPLWWLNHLHFYNLGRDGHKRPFIFSRWGGLGNHRYPIGFSGDTIIGWEALQHLPPFTSTAANVNYGWWSHDIGGHMGGMEDDELFARWVQYGLFSPVLRLHSTNNPFLERRPWGRGPAAERAASAAMRLRHAFIPYLYTMAWRNHTTSLPPVTPMYYSHPEHDAAYDCSHQYWFGSELVAAPFTAPAHPETGLSRQNVWLPEGDWFNFFTGERFTGGSWQPIYGELDNIPVFAKAGAIVPLGPQVAWNGVDNPEQLEVLFFPGAENRFELYEDEGDSNDYTKGEYALTPFSLQPTPEGLRLSIGPATGELSLLPSERSCTLALRGILPPQSVTARLNGKEGPVEASYDDRTSTLRLVAVTLRPTDELVVEVGGVERIDPQQRVMEKLRKYLTAFRLETWTKMRIYQEWPRIAAGELSLRGINRLTDAQVAVLENLL